MEDSSKEYWIFEPFLGGASCDASHKEYEAARLAREAIIVASDIEESFSLTARSYIDLEKAIMEICLEWGYKNEPHDTMDRFFDEWREVLNLKTFAFISTARAYTELLEKISSRRIIQGFDGDTFEPHRTAPYDSNFYYRVMCQLRNHAVHYGKLPISSFSIGWKRNGPQGKYEKGPVRQRITCNPSIDTAHLIASDKIQPRVRREIAALNADGLDLKMYCRGYMEAIYDLHQKVHHLTEVGISHAMQTLGEMEFRLSKTKGEAAKRTTIGNIKDKAVKDLHIDTAHFTFFMDKRQDWSKLSNLRGSYVSSESIILKNIDYGDAKDIYIPD